MRHKPIDPGFTLVELLIVVTVIGVLSAIVVPGLLRARMAGNEASAIASLRAISSAEVAYADSCGSGGFAIDLADLVKPPTASRAYISPDLDHNGVVKSGYTYTLAKNAAADTVDVTIPSCNAAGSVRASSFYATAVPNFVGQSGGRFFATDTPGTIFFSGSAIPNPIPRTTLAVQ